MLTDRTDGRRAFALVNMAAVEAHPRTFGVRREKLIRIGKGGAMLKKVSTAARHEMERFMGTKVFLQTWVKVKENWRDNANFIRSQGYDEQ